VRAAAASSGHHSPLTDRELDVVRPLSAGMSTREIAYQLPLSKKTVKQQLVSIFRKLGVTSRTEAAVVAVGQLAAR
jgi:DNA-binding NarL/FixJ family response regulator